jgi:UPF0042 nucleotide-binding protein
MSELSITILSGQAGSGKSTALRALEDQAYVCVDNIPLSMLEGLVGVVADAGAGSSLAVVIDVRDPGLLKDAKAVFERLRAGPSPVRLVYFEAHEEALIRRFSETRRRHPLDHGAGLRASLVRERDILAPIRELADDTIDTSGLSPHELRARVSSQLTGSAVGTTMRVALVSFGFKFGVPIDADMVFDVRFLPNPYFDPELRPRTGLHPDVQAHVTGSPEGNAYVSKTFAYLHDLVPSFQREGKCYLTIAFGCTGGQHRSVAVVYELAQRFGAESIVADVRHRDLPGGAA